MNQSFWEYIKELAGQLIGYITIAVSVNIVKIFYIKEDGSIWNKLGKFAASIIFGAIIGFFINDYEWSQKAKYAIVGGAAIISEKIILFWFENGISYVRDFLKGLISKLDKSKENNDNNSEIKG